MWKELQKRVGCISTVVRSGYTAHVLIKLRHYLVFLLFILLPFHALLVTFGTKILLGSGHPPHSLLALWKEALMALIFVIAILELFQSDRKIIARIFHGERWKWRISFEKGLVLALLFIAFALPLSSFHFPLSTSFVYGFKYLFVPLILFAVFSTLPWDEDFLAKKIFPALLVVGGIISLYGIIAFFLPQNFFTALGYSDAHSLYAPGSPLAAFQQVSGTGIRRIQSTFSGPNQLGLWLLIPWSIGLVDRRKLSISNFQFPINFQFSILNSQFIVRIVYIVLIALALFLTFSRSAWIAAFVITLVAMGMMLKGRTRVVGFTSIVTGVLIALVVISVAAPSLINRAISNRHHFERVRDGISTMIEYPLGLGLGSAGPASNRTSDACIYFEDGADTSWAKDRSDLCLFVGDVQTQPALDQKVCRCPRLPENWYVQVGIELGVAGGILFLLLIFIVLKRLAFSDKRLERISALTANRLSLTALLMFLGISIAALFLHAWEDSAVAYTVWGLAGIVLSAVTPSPRTPPAYPNQQTP